MAAEDAAAIYLDHAATTPVRAEVIEAMARAESEAWANPSSPHAAGRRAKRLLEDCREAILGLLGGRAKGSGRDRFVFTSGATEANRLAILGLAGRASGAFASSARDHTSIRGTRVDLAARGWQVAEMPLGADGRVDPAWQFPAEAGGRRIVATTLVCSQTGAVDDVGRCAAAHPDWIVHVDATQGIVCERVAFADLGVATLALAPHKFSGPRGIGGVIVRGDMGLEPLVPGSQEAGLRGGTEPVVLAAGFARALELAIAEQEAERSRIALLRDRFHTALVAAATTHGLVVTPVLSSRSSPHILTLAIRSIDRQAFVMAADLAGVACATGTACASGSSEPAPAIAALGLADEIASGAVRFSFGRTTTAADVDAAVERLGPVFARVCRSDVDSRPA